jgi:hypothetical protein
MVRVIAAAASRSRTTAAAASRAARLIRLISVSQSRAAASTPSLTLAAARSRRNDCWAASFASRIVRGSAIVAALSAAAWCSSYARCAAPRALCAASACWRAR